MTLVNDNRKLVVALLLVGLFAAVVLIGCAEGPHPFLGASISSECLVMTHSGALGSVTGPEAGRTSLLMAAVLLMAGGMGALVRLPASTLQVIAVHAPPGDTLNGRLRL